MELNKFGQEDASMDFASQAEEKKERIAKNELQRLRNIAKAKGGGAGFLLRYLFSTLTS